MAYPSPTQPLETVTFTLHVPTYRNDRRTRLHVTGSSEHRRNVLWSYSEEWSLTEQEDGLQPCDVVHHLALCSWQDRPNSRFLLDRSMRGLPCWEQGELPLGL